MSAEVSDLQLRLANLFRVGVVHEVDLSAGKVRVSFGNGNISDWVPWMTGRAGDVREWSPPNEGEQVCLINPGGTGNAGFVLKGGVYKNDNPANGSAPGHVELDLPVMGKWIVRCGATSIEVSASGVTIIGNLNVTGSVTVTGTVTAAAFITA
jgi:phage baseplate assembly protein gpV